MSGARGLDTSQAREAILATIATLSPESEAVPIGLARNRTLSSDLIAAFDLPPFDSAAMDGIAALPTKSQQPLTIEGESSAGSPFAGLLGPGQAISISTGAEVPMGSGIAPIETVELDAGGGSATPVHDINAGDHVRRSGEDIPAGSVALKAGSLLGVGELSVAAACGFAEIQCARRPRIAIVATGDELVAAGKPLGPGQIHESNSVTLAAAAQEAGAEVVATIRAADRLEATQEALEAAIASADIVLASGGVSVGDHDHVRPALAALGVDEVFWRVKLKPGGPTWFGCAGDGTAVFGLPGNPASAFVTFRLFAVPVIRRLLGLPELPPRLRIPLAQSLARGSREQAVRVSLQFGESGPTALPTGAQGSHRTSSLSGAWGLCFIPAGEGSVEAGEIVDVEPIHDAVGIGLGPAT